MSKHVLHTQVDKQWSTVDLGARRDWNKAKGDLGPNWPGKTSSRHLVGFMSPQKGSLGSRQNLGPWQTRASRLSAQGHPLPWFLSGESKEGVWHPCLQHSSHAHTSLPSRL